MSGYGTHTGAPVFDSAGRKIGTYVHRPDYRFLYQTGLLFKKQFYLLWSTVDHVGVEGQVILHLTQERVLEVREQDLDTTGVPRWTYPLLQLIGKRPRSSTLAASSQSTQKGS